MSNKGKKQSLAAYTGSIQQVAFARPIVYSQGYAAGLKGYDIKNNHLRFQVMTDKCLDISDLSYKGININFLSKPGLTGRSHYDTHSEDASRSIMGGFLFTCGLENICPPCTVDGKSYPMHGRIRSTPAEHSGADAYWEGDNYKIKIQGEMREADLFGENITLRRVIESTYGEKSFTITDSIENGAYRNEPLFLLYHFNIGYPLLYETTEVFLPTQKITPRDEAAEKGMETYRMMESPIPNEPEQVFIHELAADKEGNTFAAIYNAQMELGIKITYNKRTLPKFMQWKSRGAGDYAMGLEPANASVFGRADKKFEPEILQPFEKKEVRFEITIIEGKDEINKIKEELKEITKNEKI